MQDRWANIDIATACVTIIDIFDELIEGGFGGWIAFPISSDNWPARHGATTSKKVCCDTTKLESHFCSDENNCATRGK
jgi:hypothetical protein